MGEDKLRKLRHLGVVRGARNLIPAASQGDKRQRLPEPAIPADFPGEDGEDIALDHLLPGGNLVETELGSCFVLDHVYPISHLHGDNTLEELSSYSFEVAATICHDDRLAHLQVEDLLFLDTETTGLMGAGTIAFMVGVAYFDVDSSGHKAFIVRQYFLRDHADESAMLQMLSELLASRAGLVTFNGRSFDLPLLDNRYLMNRLDGLSGDLLERPHFDLLPPSRRLWRRRLGSCSLSSLEQNLLGLQRGHEDVPGWAIPGLYMDYLRSGDARQLLRVFYHNRIDMLSMVTLAGCIIHQFSQPDIDDYPLDLLSLAIWQQRIGLTDEAEENFRLVTRQDPELEVYHQVLSQLSFLLKRNNRREEAVQYWKQIAVTSFDDVTAHVELAMHYEWQDQDLATARYWTSTALDLVQKWPMSEDAVVTEELEHRLARLDRKLTIRKKD
jgi:hypothetical protein